MKKDVICLRSPTKKNDLFTIKRTKLTNRKTRSVSPVINSSVKTAEKNSKWSLNLFRDRERPLTPFCPKLGLK